MRFLFVFTHQTWPMHFFHAGVIARSLMNEGHEVIWVNCEKTMPGCHVHWILPNAPQDQICNNCTSRGGWLTTIGIKPRSLAEFITEADVEAAFSPLDVSDLDTLRKWEDMGIPVGKLAISSPASASRTITLSDPAPQLAETLPVAISSAIIVNRALMRLLDTVKIDRCILHLGRLIPEAVTQFHLRARNIDWFCYETGGIKNSVRIVKNSDIYSYSNLRESWQKYKNQDLTPTERLAVLKHLDLREGEASDTGILTYSPSRGSKELIKKILKLDGSKKLITIFTSSLDETSTLSIPTDPDWTPLYDSQFDGIRSVINLFSNDKRLTIAIRIHPNEGSQRNHLRTVGKKSLEEFSKIMPNSGHEGNIHIFWPDDDISSHDLADLSDASIVWSSTIGLEIASRGKPVVVLDDPIYRVAECCSTPRSRSEVEAEIRALLVTDTELQVQRREMALRWAFHEYIRSCLPMPMVVDHGRMERVSTNFESPKDLNRNVWPELGPILDYIAMDTQLY